MPRAFISLMNVSRSTPRLGRIDPYDEEMPRMHVVVRRYGKWQHARHAREPFAIVLGEPCALAVHLVEARELTHAERRVHVRQVVLVTGLDDLGLRRAALGLALICVRGEPVKAQASHARRELLRVGADDAAFARREVLDRMQREDRRAARAELLPGVRRARDVRGIFDERNAAPARERAQRLEVEPARPRSARG